MISLTLSLLIFLFPLAYSPGPGNMYFAASGARYGFAKTLSANAGYHLATFIVTLFIGVSYQWASAATPTNFVVLRYAGAAYIIYLAWSLANAGTMAQEVEADSLRVGVRFWDGVILLLLNPKAYLIIILIFSQFIPMGRAGNYVILLWVAIVFTLNNLVAFGIWAYAGDRIANKFRNNDSAIIINRVFAMMLVLVAIWMLL